MLFKHYIIVRFFLRSGFKNKKIAAQKDVDYRIKILNKFFIKSMKRQTCQNFEVMLLVDEMYKSLDFSAIKSVKNINIIFDNNQRDSLKYMDKKCEYYITTRIDSDDFVCDDFVELIQSNFLIHKKEMLIDFETVNFISSDYSQHSIREYKYRTMFLPTCFKVADFNSKFCYAKGHGQLHSVFFRKVSIPKKNVFCLVHGRNIINRIKSGHIVNNKKIINLVKSIYK